MATVTRGDSGVPFKSAVVVCDRELGFGGTYVVDNDIRIQLSVEPGQDVTIAMSPDEALQFSASLISRLANRVKAMPQIAGN